MSDLTPLTHFTSTEKETEMIDEEALEAARLAVEDILIELRDSRISILGGGNGFVCREADGKESSIMRMSTRDGLRIGIKAYLEVLKKREAS